MSAPTAAAPARADNAGTTIGPGLNRIDGPLKVAGEAAYPNDFRFADLAHGAFVQSTIAAGRIRSIDIAVAERASGVLAVLTHRTVPALAKTDVKPPPPFTSDKITFRGQYVALVVAETLDQARDAAALVDVSYEQGDPLVDPHDPRVAVESDVFSGDTDRGDFDAGLQAAAVQIDQQYSTAANTNNPLGLFSTIAAWDGDQLTVHDATQGPAATAKALAEIFGIDRGAVRVVAPYLGGGFGAGLRVWPHIVATAIAARQVKRPVKVELTRPQMFTGTGHRPATTQRVVLGATPDGMLTALAHESTVSAAMLDDTMEHATGQTPSSYAVENLRTRDAHVRLNVPSPGAMRAPGEAPGNFALETALDELAVALAMDPIELRRRNYAEINPDNGFAWSSKALDECYTRGAELIGWAERGAEARREANWRIGYGMAGVSFFWWQPPCRATVRWRSDGSASVHSSSMDIGTGTYTVMAQLTAELLDIEPDAVTVELGDTAIGGGATAGGSGLTAALGNAIADACRQINEQRSAAEKASSSALPESIEAVGSSKPPPPEKVQLSPSGAFGARFVKLRVDADLGIVKLDHIVSVIDAGRILNDKTARSQILGGTVGGIGHALFEATETDTVGPIAGRIANATFADYLIPVNADIPQQTVEFVGCPDKFNGIGVKGVGEIGLVGIAAAVGNAIFHATGRRLREIPFRLESLL